MWLENRGNTLQTYQMRVYAWSHTGSKEELTEQDDIVGSPPIMQIEPGKRQLVRLIRTGTPPPGKEMTYRVILDEIPSAEPEAPDKANGVKFRMRYSIPVFVFGEGLASQSMQGNGKTDADKVVVDPSLSWRIKNDRKQKTLEVSNKGPIHVHLRNLTFARRDGMKTDPGGAAGYILPGKTMSWPVTAEMGSGSTLLGIINGKQLVRIMPPIPKKPINRRQCQSTRKPETRYCAVSDDVSGKTVTRTLLSILISYLLLWGLPPL